MSLLSSPLLSSPLLSSRYRSREQDPTSSPGEYEAGTVRLENPLQRAVPEGCSRTGELSARRATGRGSIDLLGGEEKGRACVISYCGICKYFTQMSSRMHNHMKKQKRGGSGWAGCQTPRAVLPWLGDRDSPAGLWQLSAKPSAGVSSPFRPPSLCTHPSNNPWQQNSASGTKDQRRS